MSKEEVVAVAGPVIQSVISVLKVIPSFPIFKITPSIYFCFLLSLQMTTYQINNPGILDYDKAKKDRVYETDLESDTQCKLFRVSDN